MIPTSSYGDICRVLTRRYNKRYSNCIEYPKRMVGVIFARPDLRFVKEEILPSLNYFHFRAGWHIDFFFVGYSYSRNKPLLNDTYETVTVEGKQWNFSNRKFNKFREEVESITRWRYSGGVDLILLDAFYNNYTQKVQLDFSDAISIQLDNALKDEAIESIPTFFESIFRFAEDDVPNPSFTFSDRIGLRKGFKEIFNNALSLLPFNIGSSAKKLSYFCVRDIGL